MVQQQVTVERGQGPCVAFRSAKGVFYMAPQHVTTETHNLNHAGQPADGAIEGAAAIRLDLGPNFGLSGPSVGGEVGHTILRAHTAMDAPCAIARASWDLRLSEFSADGTGWQSVAVFHRPSISPRSRFSAWAGRHALEGQGHFLTLLGAATDVLLVTSKSRAVFWQPAHLRGVAQSGTKWQHFAAAPCHSDDRSLIAIGYSKMDYVAEPAVASDVRRACEAHTSPRLLLLRFGQ